MPTALRHSRAGLRVSCANGRVQQEKQRSILKRGPAARPKTVKGGPARRPAPPREQVEGPLLSNPAALTEDKPDVNNWEGGYFSDDADLGWTQSAETATASATAGMIRGEKGQRKELVTIVEPPTVVTRIPEHLRRSVLANALFLLDKPPNWTATECTQSLKWALKVPKIGHSGALDSSATGLVVVMTGVATKLNSAFTELEREYTGVIRLGQATDTGDAAGKITETAPWKHITDVEVQRAVGSLQGEVMQVPPSFSNVKFQGKPLHKYARKGKTIEMAPRPVYVKSFTVQWLAEGTPDLRFHLVAGQGTNVRGLAQDLGRLLGTKAHVAECRRMAVGGFRVADAWPMDVLIPLIRKYQPGFRDG